MTEKQRGVLKVMISGLSVSVMALIWGYFINPLRISPNIEMQSRMTLMAAAMVVPLVFVVVSVARITRHSTVHDAVALRGDVGSTLGIFFQAMRDDTQPDILSFDDPTAAL